MWKAALVAVLGISSVGLASSLEVTTFAPDPGETVVLTVSEAPAGASFRWDLDGDGFFEKTTDEPRAQLLALQGFHTVRMEITSAGRTVAQKTLGLICDPRLGAYRTVSWEGNALLVTVFFLAKTEVIAPGFEEEIPGGAGLEVVADGGAFWRRGERLEVVWPLILERGMSPSFSYRLYPLSGQAVTFAGVASGYVEGKRVEVKIGGHLQP